MTLYSLRFLSALLLAVVGAACASSSGSTLKAFLWQQSNGYEYELKNSTQEATSRIVITATSAGDKYLISESETERSANHPLGRMPLGKVTYELRIERNRLIEYSQGASRILLVLPKGAALPAWTNKAMIARPQTSEVNSESCEIVGVANEMIFDSSREVVQVQCRTSVDSARVTKTWRYASGVGLIERTIESAGLGPGSDERTTMKLVRVVGR